MSFLVFAALLLAPPAAAESPTIYDIVIAGGTVIDPQSGLHAPMHVGIEGGTIMAVSGQPLRGKRTLDATGKYVVPGFIDVASYGPIGTASLYKVADGVTTALSLHGGASRFGRWKKLQEMRRPMVNYGATMSHSLMRGIIGPTDRYAAAEPDQIRWMEKRARQGIKQGAIGIAFSLEYLPGTSTDEVHALGEIAAEMRVPLFFHLRYSDPDPPGTNQEAVAEAIEVARETGGAVHIHHITSTGGTFTMQQTLAQIEKARATGLQITANLYPYDFWATYLNSARFDPGWRERFRIDYGDLQLAGSTERLTEKSFSQYRKTDMVVVAYAIPEEDVVAGLETDWIMLGSDTAITKSGNNHPRGAGCYARVLGKYVRDEKVLTLDEAIRRMTLTPAQTFEAVAPALKKKGRVQVGADADLVVFDLATVHDAATVVNPRQYSRGILYVLVAGRLVREHDIVHYLPTGRLIASARAGVAKE